MFDKLFAVCLLVKDFEKSLGFYKNVLGLEVNVQEDGFANFRLVGTELAIFQKDAATAMFPENHMGSTGGNLVAFQVENVENTCKDLTKKGVEIFEGPKTTPWGQTVAYFKDPDGHIWEVTGE